MDDDIKRELDSIQKRLLGLDAKFDSVLKSINTDITVNLADLLRWREEHKDRADREIERIDKRYDEGERANRNAFNGVYTELHGVDGQGGIAARVNASEKKLVHHGVFITALGMLGAAGLAALVKFLAGG